MVVVLVWGAPYLFSFYPLKRIVEEKIEKNIDGKVTIDHVRFSWFGPQRLEGVHILTPQINGIIDLASSNVPFWKIGSFVSGLEQINGSGTTNADGESGRFSVDALRLPTQETTIQFSATQMPTNAILQLLRFDSSLKSAIGPNFNAKGSTSFLNDAGRFDLDFSSPNTQASLKTEFTPREITLREPLTLAGYLTPELTRYVTNGAISLESKTPTRLRIEQEGFSYPRPFSLERLQIPTASLDLSRVILEHANLAPLAALLKANSLTASQIDMWLTSVDCSLQKGRFDMGRIDALLANSIHLCAWGKVDLLKDKLNLIFGIPADTLANSFRINNLSSTYVLQVPITGSLKNPNIDANSATAKIALLIAGNQVKKQGGVLGGVATVIGKVSEDKSPPPKRPFPWE
jgi:hypothetical protein